MAFKQDEPPAYGPPPGAPQPTYGGYQQDPYMQGGAPPPGGPPPQGYYQQAPPQMGYPHHPFPAGALILPSRDPTASILLLKATTPTMINEETAALVVVS